MDLLTKLNKFQDPRVEHLLLMGSPIKPIIILILYLVFCLKIGPELMKNRNPFKLTKLMTLINIIQIIGNSYIVLKYTRQTFQLSMTCAILPTDTTPQTLSYIQEQHLYLLLKYFDLIDTVVYVLRKKQSQVTFLNLFHHTGLAFLAWIACNYFPGGVPLWATWLNSLVHALMYLYYLISSQMKINKKWKQALTKIQLVHQFLSVLSLVVPMLNPSCTFPKWYLFSLSSYVVIVIVLFFNFYNTSYIKK